LSSARSKKKFKPQKEVLENGKKQLKIYQKLFAEFYKYELQRRNCLQQIKIKR
jgi:hypothetical protein